MKLSLAPAALLSLMVTLFGSAETQTRPVIDLWPEGVPGFRPDAPKEVSDNSGHVSQVDHPSLTLYRADPAKSKGTAMIICPGGGYVRLAYTLEGVSVAQWLNSLGIDAFILKYRLKEYGHPAPLQDVLRAVRTVRSRASEFQIKPDQIGVIGASAGGHLAASAGTLYDAAEGKTGAALDAVSARPNFLVLMYPVITMREPYVHKGSLHALLGANPDPKLVDELSLDERVTKDTPPCFIIQSQADQTVPVENSIRFYEALHKAGVPSELHLYEIGPHGTGISKGHGPIDDWPAACETWLRFNRWIVPNHP